MYQQDSFKKSNDCLGIYIVDLVATAIYCEWIKAYRNSWTLNARVGRWTLQAGLWTLDSGRWTLHAGLWTLDSAR